MARRVSARCRMSNERGTDERDAKLLEMVEAASIEGLAEHMKGLGGIRDCEERHWEADALLCAILRKLGHGVVVDEYDKLEKYWA